MLLDTLKNDKLNALKNHERLKKDILNIVLQKCQFLEIEKRTKGLELTEEDCFQAIQKTLKELEEERKSFSQAALKEHKYISKVMDLKIQKEVLLAYIPEQLTIAEIKEILATIEDKSLPFVMKYFKAHYAGQVDMKLVNQIVKENAHV